MGISINIIYYNCFSGVGKQLRDIREGRETGDTTQVLRILHTFKHSPYITPSSFLLTHSHFTRPETVLQQHIHLLSIEHNVTKFIEFDKDVGAQLFDTRKYPILPIAHMQNAKKIIHMSRPDFDRMVSELETEDREVVWMFHTGRCGSTLCSQIFNSLPNWTVISENEAHIYTISHSDCELTALSYTERYEKLVTAWVRLYLRLIPSGHSVFWKANIVDPHIIPVLRKRFPKHKILFSYRDVLTCGKSYFRAFGSINGMLFAVYYILNPWLKRGDNDKHSKQIWLCFTNGYDKNRCLAAIRSALPDPGVMEWFVLFWATTITMMREYQQAGVKFKCLKYEQLQSNPREVITDLFSYLNIPTEHVSLALQTMDTDSQAGLFFDRENRDNSPVWNRTEESVRKCNSILRNFNLPQLDTPYFLPIN